MQSRSCKTAVVLKDKMIETQQTVGFHKICDCANEATC